MLPLGNERYLVYSKFKGADWVNIREYKRKNGFLLASKVGICMTYPIGFHHGRSRPRSDRHGIVHLAMEKCCHEE